MQWAGASPIQKKLEEAEKEIKKLKSSGIIPKISKSKSKVRGEFLVAMGLSREYKVEKPRHDNVQFAKIDYVVGNISGDDALMSYVRNVENGNVYKDLDEKKEREDLWVHKVFKVLITNIWKSSNNENLEFR